MTSFQKGDKTKLQKAKEAHKYFKKQMPAKCMEENVKDSLRG